MPIVQTSFGPKPTQSLLGGSATSLATSSVPLASFGGRSLALGGGRHVSFASIYRSQPWVAAAANVLSRQIARLPLKCYRFTDDAEDNRERVRDHPLAVVLNRPEPGRRGLHLRHAIAQGLYVHGNFAAYKRRPRPGAPPDRLVPLDWRLLVAHGEHGRIIAWEWHGAPEVCPRILLPEDVLHVAWGAPDGDLGVSPLEQLGVTVRTEDNAQRYSESSFRNGTRFGVAAILDKSVTADKVTRDGLRDELVATHGGVDNAFLPAILGGGVTDLKPLGTQTAVEAELIDVRKIARDEIAAVYGVPQPIVGILDHATYSNVAEMHRMLYVTCLGPPLSLIAETLQAQLVDVEPAFAGSGVFVEFDLGEVLKGDTRERMDAYKTAIGAGVLTLNDVRRLENRAPYDDPAADEPLVQANNVLPLSAIGAQGDANAAGAPAVGLASILARHAGRALERAARGVGAGRSAADSLDAERVERELRADLERAGSNGSSAPLARALAEALQHDVAEQTTVDGVRAVADRYTRTAPA